MDFLGVVIVIVLITAFANDKKKKNRKNGIDEMNAEEAGRGQHNEKKDKSFNLGVENFVREMSQLANEAATKINDMNGGSYSRDAINAEEEYEAKRQKEIRDEESRREKALRMEEKKAELKKKKAAREKAEKAAKAKKANTGVKDKGAILERAIDGASEDFDDDNLVLDAGHHENCTEVHYTESEDLMKKVSDLMILGPNCSMSYERDFVAEGEKMVADFALEKIG